MSLPLSAILIAFFSWFAQAGAADHATVRIIVVGTAEEAARVAGLLANGADFGGLAKSLSSIRPPSAADYWAAWTFPPCVRNCVTRSRGSGRARSVRSLAFPRALPS